MVRKNSLGVTNGRIHYLNTIYASKSTDPDRLSNSRQTPRNALNPKRTTDERLPELNLPLKRPNMYGKRLVIICS
jgi:hypothetical protein